MSFTPKWACSSVESTDTCVPVGDQEGLGSRVKTELSAHIPPLRSHVQRRDPCLSFLSSAVLAGTLPSPEGGGGPPSVQLLCTPAPPPLLQLFWLHQFQPRLGGGGGQEKRGLLHVSG